MHAGEREMMADQAGKGGVQSIERVLDVLEILSSDDTPKSLSEVALASGLPLPTIHRLLRTLGSRGYVRRAAGRRYALGSRLIPLGESAVKQLGTESIPALRSVVAQLDETANMAVLDGALVSYVAQVPSTQSMRMFTQVGQRVHAHSSGVGKAILCQFNDDAVRSIVKRAGMPTPTEKTLGTVEALLEDLEKCRKRGYAIDDGEQEISVRCIAVPVPGAPTPTAISVSGPAQRMGADFDERAVPLLLKAAALVADSMSDDSMSFD
jgi:IclR family transcriptional regulator, acetate operon repressor